MPVMPSLHSGKVTRPIANYDSIKFDVNFNTFDQNKFVNSQYFRLV